MHKPPTQNQAPGNLPGRYRFLAERPSVYFFLALALRAGTAALARHWLPEIGYDTPVQRAGYLFYDAFARDQQAWALASSGRPLAEAFGGAMPGDQYGGLLFLLAAFYRAIGSHQMLATALLSALAGSAAVFSIHAAARRLLGPSAAAAACLLYALYPDSILLGAAHMREPYLMLLLAAILDGFLRMRAGESSAAAWTALAGAGILLISPGFLLLAAAALAGWAALGRRRAFPWQVLAAGLAAVLAAAALLAVRWRSAVPEAGESQLAVIAAWLQGTARWNAHVLLSSSGVVQLLASQIPPILFNPFLAAYGVLQPVLPAALADPALPVWTAAAALRAFAWFVLLPILACAPAAALQNRKNGRLNWQILWLALIVWGWIALAAVRGGADSWDNPRYRAAALPWIALLAAYTAPRLVGPSRQLFTSLCLALGALFIAFGQWYLARTYHFGPDLGIQKTIIAAGALAAAFIAVQKLKHIREFLSSFPRKNKQAKP